MQENLFNKEKIEITIKFKNLFKYLFKRFFNIYIT